MSRGCVVSLLVGVLLLLAYASVFGPPLPFVVGPSIEDWSLPPGCRTNAPGLVPDCESERSPRTITQ